MSNGSLITTNIPKAKYGFLEAPMLFYILYRMSSQKLGIYR
jgi:hypothetical protein